MSQDKQKALLDETKWTQKQKLIAAILREHPGAPKKTLARLLHKKWPLEFATVESARSHIRNFTGASGTKRPRCVPERDLREPCTIRVPEGDTQAKPDLQIDEGRWLITGDWHVPFHSKQSLEAMFAHAIAEGCDAIYLNGDIVDFYQASHWTRDPRQRNIQQELQLLHEILDGLAGHFTRRKVYKIGNHEERLTHRVYQSTPELAVLPAWDVEKVLEVEGRGYEVVASKQFARFAKLWGFHGHELPRGLTNPVNIARGLCLRVREASFTSHWHATSGHTDPGGVSKQIESYFSLGCMCDLRPDYAPVNKWNHGFAVCEVSNGTYQFQNFKVADGTCYRG